MSTIVLDAWAVLALLNDEPAAGDVESALVAHEPVMSWVNLGEVLYISIRRRGRQRAFEAFDAVRQQLRTELPDERVVTEAALVKSGRRLSYGDAFAVATAQRHRAPLYTGDPELIALSDLVDVVDLRPSA